MAASVSTTIDDEPADVAAADALNLAAGTKYRIQYLGNLGAYITIQTSADDANAATASQIGTGDWLSVTRASGEGVYMWTLGATGTVVAHTSLE